MKYTLGRASLDDPYHVDIIREKLMRTLPVVLPDVIDELTVAVPDYIPTHGAGAFPALNSIFMLSPLTRLRDAEWTTVSAMPTMQKIVARASNRVFVGTPLCAYPLLLRDPGVRRLMRGAGRKQDYLDLAIRFTMDVVKDRTILIFFPHILRP